VQKHTKLVNTYETKLVSTGHNSTVELRLCGLQKIATNVSLN